MRIFLPLRHAMIARVWSALAFSALGDQLYAVAIGWVAVGVLGAGAGYLSAGRAGVVLLTAMLGGGLADGWSRQRTMIGADLLRCAVLTLLVGAWAMAGQPSPLLLTLAVIVLAIGEAFFQPALQTVLPALVPESGLLVATNGLLDATDRLARLLGPGLIALVGALVPPIHFLTLDAVSFAVSALAVASLRLPPSHGQARGIDPGGWWTGALRGFAVMRRKRLFSFLLHVSGVLNGAWYAVFYLAVPLVIAGQGLGGEAGGLGLYGLIIASYGVSNLIANLFVGSRALPERPARLIFAGVFLTGLGILAMGAVCLLPMPAAVRVPALAAASALAGFGGPLKDIPFATLRQMLIPNADIAAGMRAYMAVVYTGMLVAMLIAPSACAWLGAPQVIVLSGAIYLAVAVLGGVQFVVRRQPDSMPGSA